MQSLTISARALGLLVVLGIGDALADEGPAQSNATLYRSELDVELAQWNSTYDLTKPDINYVERLETWPVWDYIPKFVQVVDADSVGDDTIEVAMWLMSLQEDTDKRAYVAITHVLDRIERRWMDHPRIPELLVSSRYRLCEPVEEFARSCTKKSNRRSVRGVAHLTLAAQLQMKARYPELLKRTKFPPGLREYMNANRHPDVAKYLASIDPAKAQREATELIARANAEFADVTYPDSTMSAAGYPTVQQVVRAIESRIPPLERLKIGVMAPAINGVDLDGKKMSLSELRGNVVVIDFWASWCAPCIAQIRAMKELASKYRDRGVTFVGFNVDRDRAEGKQAAIDELIPWRSWHIEDHDESLEFVREVYGVFGYPWVIVIDATGRVWFNAFVVDEDGKLRGDSSEQMAALDSAIESCLAGRRNTAANSVSE